MTDWLMCGLTAIYVFATWRILISNKRSADAAAEQIEESRCIQEQNVALQLLNQRIDIYKALTFWVENARIICTGDMHYKDSLPKLQALIFNNAMDDFSEKVMEIELIENELKSYAISRSDREALVLQRNHLKQDVFMKKIAMLNQELKLIELAEVCFKDVDFSVIKEFMNAYIDMAVNIGNEIQEGNGYRFANALKKSMQKMTDKEILIQMKNEMKFFN